MSPTPCWRRIQKLEASGVIRGRVARLDLGLTVFVHLRIARHNANWDYLLRVLVTDRLAYDQFYKRLIEIEGLNYLSSSFSMQQIKFTTALPLDHLCSPSD